jgi:hypothetical protein
MYSRSLQD